MSKSKSKRLERMAAGRTDHAPVTTRDLYQQSPPKLTAKEVRHFHFGSRGVLDLFDDLAPILIASQRSGHTASTVAKTLNSRGLKTACGARWDRRLAWFAMKLWREAENQKRIVEQTRHSHKSANIDRAVRRNIEQKIRAHARRHFVEPCIGDKYPELATLRDRLKKLTNEKMR